jgi:pantoate--beta-alanine ligase
VNVVRTVAEARAALRSLPRPLGFAPTMGALHDGHLQLVRTAKQRCAAVAASLFVNPTQFAPGEDLKRYPRDEARDVELFAQHGVSLLFAPPAGEMYPDGFSTVVHVGGPLGESFEGDVRGSHFDGVATIVVKMLDVVQPDVLFLGEKDAQQLAVLRRVVRDLDLPMKIAGVPTVREPDGLAVSSRNAYLTPEQRAVAPDLYLALLAGARAADAPGAGPEEAVAAATALATPAAGTNDRRGELPGAPPTGSPRFAIDYIAAVNADTFAQERELGPRSLLIGAARLGDTRLIDNVWLTRGLRAAASTPTH